MKKIKYQLLFRKGRNGFHKRQMMAHAENQLLACRDFSDIQLEKAGIGQTADISIVRNISKI